MYDVVSLQNQHWPQPALRPELPTQGQAGEVSISYVPDEQIEASHTPQVPDRLAEDNRAQYIPDGAQEGRCPEPL